MTFNKKTSILLRYGKKVLLPGYTPGYKVVFFGRCFEQTPQLHHTISISRRHICLPLKRIYRLTGLYGRLEIEKEETNGKPDHLPLEMEI